MSRLILFVCLLFGLGLVAPAMALDRAAVQVQFRGWLEDQI